MGKKLKTKLWIPAEIRNTLPLVKSILQTIREQSLCNNSALHRMTKRVSQREHVLLREAADRAATAILEALTELQELSVFCVQPIQAVAAFAVDMPCPVVSALVQPPAAWVFYELYSGDLYWRYETDSDDMRRNFAEIESPI